MGEFSESSMPEPDLSADVPDVEPETDIVAESPAESEPASDVVNESYSESEPAADIVEETPTLSEPTVDTAFESDSSPGFSPEMESADTLTTTEQDAIPDPQTGPDLTSESFAQSQFEPSSDLPFESDPSWESPPANAQEVVPETPVEAGATFAGMPEYQPEPTPELPFESEPSAESLPGTSPEIPPELPQEASFEAIADVQSALSPEVAGEQEVSTDLPSEFPAEIISNEQLEASPQAYEEPSYAGASQEELPFKGPEQTELYHSPETTKEIEPGTGPNPSWDEQPDGSLNEPNDAVIVGEESLPTLDETGGEQPASSENPVLDPTIETDPSENMVAEMGRDVTLDTPLPPDISRTQSVKEPSDLKPESTSEESMYETPTDTTTDVQPESSPKFYLDGEEVTLPGDGQREYRIGSPHQDFEDYKKIVEAERQHDLGVAAQTSDSFGEAAGNLIEAQQGGTDFTEINTYMYEKIGHEPYTDAAYPQSDDSSLSSLSGDSQPSENEKTSSLIDSPLPVMPADITDFNDSQERNITVKRWGDEKLIQLRAYDTDMGAVPENPNVGTAGMTNLQVEAALDGSTQIRLQDIVIPPDYRKSGIAGNMLDQTVAIAKAKGASEIYGVIENEEALSYWKHMEEKGTGWKVDSSQGAYGQVRYSLGSEVKKK